MLVFTAVEQIKMTHNSFILEQRVAHELSLAQALCKKVKSRPTAVAMHAL